MRRLSLCHLPTPLFHSSRLDDVVGTEVWVKRDDCTGGAESGNKLRKLEFLFARALEQGASCVVTCGGIQSNHARATALMARRLGLGATLLLRATDEQREAPLSGNLLLDEMCGADVRFITKERYARRDSLMLAMKRELDAADHKAYVIPEGGSNGLGALGYVEAMRELRQQLDAREAKSTEPFDAVAVACGSGGTAAGVAVGSGQFETAKEVLAFAVCDDAATFQERIASIVDDVARLDPAHRQNRPPVAVRVLDEYKGPAYGEMTPEQLDFIVRVARESGLVLDPVYTGKALFGLSQLADKPRRVLFIHTGGLPGLLAESATLEQRLTDTSTHGTA